MEEAIVKLLKITARNMRLFYQYGCDAENTVSCILADAELKIHEEARTELIEYLRTLN